MPATPSEQKACMRTSLMIQFRCRQPRHSSNLHLGMPMQTKCRFYLLLAVLVFFPLSPSMAQKTPGQVPAPSEFLKIEVGADRQLADYHQISSYFKALAAASPRLEIEILGKTTLSGEMVLA